MRECVWPSLGCFAIVVVAACSERGEPNDPVSPGGRGGDAGSGAFAGSGPAGGVGSSAAGGAGGAPSGGTGGGASGTPGSAGGAPVGGSAGSAGTLGGAGGAPAGGNAGTAGTSGGAGGAAASAGGAPAGGSAGTAGTSGGAGGPPESWHAAVAEAITDELLADEYGTWKSRHVQSCSDGSAVVKKDAGSVVSEGIGYGMLLAAAFDDRALLDGLFKYYADHADANGLMNWSTGLCDPAENNNANAATDGDLDVLMALLQAAARWSDGSYLADAEALGATIITHETELCDGRAILRPGDEFGGCSDTAQARVNPSYFAPGYYRVFAAKFPAQAERWTALRTGSYELYPLYQARMSGLVPDWAAVDGSDWYGATYSYDACRTPWRVMVDYAWSGEPKAKTFLEGVSAWVTANGLGSQPNNSAFIGAFALATAYDQAKLDSAVTAWLAGNGDDTPYFQGTLRLLYLLAAAGKFPSTL